MEEKRSTELCDLTAGFSKRSHKRVHIFLNLTGNILSFHDVLTEVCGGLLRLELNFILHQE